MNNNPNYNVNIELPISGSMSHCENFSSSTSSAYEDISPQQHNSTPVSNDSHSGRQNNSTQSSKKSEISHVSSDDTNDLTVDNLERTLTEESASKIEEILTMLSSLNDKEKMLIQLRFPLSEKDNFDDGNGDISGLYDFGIGANQNEHSEALTWVMSHLEEDQSTCIKKQDVYDDYKSYCLSHNVKYLSTADFGKVMKKAFPNVKARRLGSRGQSKYCYSGLKNINQIKSPMLIDVGNCCNKITGKISETVSNQDRNSDLDSNSSSCPQPDLSHIPEYELSSNILVDSALVIMEFIKRVGLIKDVTSLKQAVEHLLLNNQVEMRSPYVLRLLPLIQQLENQKANKKFKMNTPLSTHLELQETLCRPIKKEETIANPPFSAITNTHSPQQLKRPKLAFQSPIPMFGHNNKVSSTPPLSAGNGYCHPGPNTNTNTTNNASYNYALNNNITQQYYNQNLMSMSPNIARTVHNSRPEMSPIANTSIGQKSYLPNSFSTPIKDSPSKNISPTLNSPLLERNPTTTKKLELSNSTKNPYANSSINYPCMQQQQPPQAPPPQQPPLPHTQQQNSVVTDKSSKLHQMCGSPAAFHYEYNQLKNNKSYLDIDIASPSCNQMTSRNYSVFNEEYNGELDDLETPLPIKRHIGNDYPMDFNVSPRLSHYVNDNEYGANLSSLSSGYRQQSCEENEYLDTPGNSPTNRSTDQEPSDNSSRNNTPQNCSRSHLSLVMDFNPKNVFSLNAAAAAAAAMAYSNNNNNTNNNNNHSNQHLTYAMEPVNGINDEFSVSSTTNSCLLDIDRHPNTTMLHNTIYK